MLDDLYTDETLTRAPSWSSEEALDEVFASWVPGPSEHAGATERSMVAGSGDEVAFIPTPTMDEWLLETEPVAAPPVVAGPARWSPSDDDILPAKRRSRRRR